jgi:hypothetical protein
MQQERAFGSHDRQCGASMAKNKVSKSLGDVAAFPVLAGLLCLDDTPSGASAPVDQA